MSDHHDTRSLERSEGRPGLTAAQGSRFIRSSRSVNLFAAKDLFKGYGQIFKRTLSISGKARAMHNGKSFRLESSQPLQKLIRVGRVGCIVSQDTRLVFLQCLTCSTNDI